MNYGSYIQDRMIEKKFPFLFELMLNADLENYLYNLKHIIIKQHRIPTYLRICFSDNDLVIVNVQN